MKPKFASAIEFAEVAIKHRASLSATSFWSKFFRIYDVHLSTGTLKVPEEFSPTVAGWFSTGKKEESRDEVIARAEHQKIVRVFNRWTFEQTQYNTSRSFYQFRGNNVNHATEHQEVIQHDTKNCDFCDPLHCTAEDSFGRLTRDTCMTAANIGKYDSIHSLIVFKEHNPLHYSKEKMYDMLSIAEELFEKANAANKGAVYPMLAWNCRSRGGASQSHGHCHALLAERFHFAKSEQLQQIATNYCSTFPGSSYFEDLIAIHHSLGLAMQVGTAHILFSLTPKLQGETVVVATEYGSDFQRAFHTAMTLTRTCGQCLTFSAAVLYPALEDGKLPQTSFRDVKQRLPYLAFIVDRGSPSPKSKTSDICAMTLYGSPVICIDPFTVYQSLPTEMDEVIS